MDPYAYPGTNVLRNLRNIRDLDQLSRFEMDMSTRRLAELSQQPGIGQWDTIHLQRIHRHIFQDVYVWAGELRTVNIARAGQFYFAFVDQILPSLSRLFRQLHAEHYLRGADSSAFCARVAYYMGEINAIHPFRDGNGRAQREFMRQLALRNGYGLNWAKISRQQMYDASKTSFQRGSNRGLEQLLQAALEIGGESDGT